MGRLKRLVPRAQAIAPRAAMASGADRDKVRSRAQPWRAWYSSAKGRRLRLEVLRRDEWTCQQTGVLLIGKHPAPNSPVVDHKVPHRGDPALFFDAENCQAVSKAWHDSEKQKQERAGLA